MKKSVISNRVKYLVAGLVILWLAASVLVLSSQKIDGFNEIFDQATEAGYSAGYSVGKRLRDLFV